jgi:hypothetical protein
MFDLYIFKSFLLYIYIIIFKHRLINLMRDFNVDILKNNNLFFKRIIIFHG